VLGHGCVQEEIRFVINPEMIVAKLFTECLGAEEALVMIGCEQFNSYIGYAASFEWANDFKDKTPIDIYKRRKTRVVAIDASPYNCNAEQFKESTILRELNKAYVGFHGDKVNDKSPIASGLWGCGAFNGIGIRSALIQLMACAVTHRNLVFYTHGDARTRDEVAEVFETMCDKNKVTVGYLFRLLKRYFMEGQMSDLSNLIPFFKKGASSYKAVSTSGYVAQVDSVTALRKKELFKFMNASPKLSKSLPSSGKDQAPVQPNKAAWEAMFIK
jgi:poly(ADP-ribose) glycohydrolase